MGQDPLRDYLDLFSSPRLSRFHPVEVLRLPFQVVFISRFSSLPFKPQKPYLHFPDIADLLQSRRCDYVCTLLGFGPTTREWLLCVFKFVYAHGI